MWPKNIRFYSFTESFTHTSETVNDALEEKLFSPLTALQESTFGWVPPFKGSELYCEAISGCLLFSAQVSEKILPASVVNDALNEKLDAIEEAEGRRPAKKEREQLKEDIRAELLPKAFIKVKQFSAWIDPKREIMAVCAASEKAADELTASLREALGSLSIVPIGSAVAGADLLTQWYLEPDSRPANTEIEAHMELTLLQDSTVKARYKNLDLNAPELKLSLESGMRIEKLALTREDQMSFVIDEKLTLKRIKYDNKLIEQAHESEDARADTVLMLDSVGQWLDALKPLITE